MTLLPVSERVAANAVTGARRKRALCSLVRAEWRARAVPCQRACVCASVGGGRREGGLERLCEPKRQFAVYSNRL